MKPPVYIVLMLLLCGSLAVFTVVGEDESKNPGGSAPSADSRRTAMPDRAEVSGRVAVRDLETGLLRAPEGSELAAESRAELRAPAAVVHQFPGGGMARVTPLHELSFTVVTRQSDGKLSHSCAPDLNAAGTRLKDEKLAATAKEHAHDR